MPHRITEVAERSRRIDAFLSRIENAAQPVPKPEVKEAPAAASQVYRGYSDADLSVFDSFTVTASPQPGFVTDFLGVHTRATFLAGLSAPDGLVQGLPIPGDNVHAETIEWVGLLKSVLSARGRFTCMELGAGYGPWIVAGAIAARQLGITDIHLTGVEADPGHFVFMQDHLHDNGLASSAHTLLQAAVGVEAGQARWPKVADPAADWGSRPVAVADTDRGDHLGRQFEEWLTIEVVAFVDLLRRQSTWDLVHIDVQGWEADLCHSAAELLDQRVRWMVVATHDPKLHGLVMEQMHRQGWKLENEKPPRVDWRPGSHCLQAMTSLDGTQVWRNMALI